MSNKKSFSPIVRMPSSFLLGLISSFTMIIFLKESLILNSDADSCASFSNVGMAKADWM